MIDPDRYGPWAVIAGGSEGVGAGFGRLLAEAGLNLLLIARNPGPLEVLANSLSGVEVRTLALDLTADDAVAQVMAATAELDVGLFIYNAGAVTRFSPFVDEAPEAADRLVRLNVATPTALAHRFGDAMKRRGKGGMMFLGSIAGYAGAPDEIVYGASKAYLRIFAEGLWYELKPHGVDVLGFILGLTRTPAMERMGLDMNNPDFPPADPDSVAAEGLDYLAKGPIRIVGGGDAGTMLSTLPRDQAVAFMAAGAKALHG